MTSEKVAAMRLSELNLVVFCLEFLYEPGCTWSVEIKRFLEVAKTLKHTLRCAHGFGPFSTGFRASVASSLAPYFSKFTEERAYLERVVMVARDHTAPRRWLKLSWKEVQKLQRSNFQLGLPSFSDPKLRAYTVLQLSPIY